MKRTLSATSLSKRLSSVLSLSLFLMAINLNAVAFENSVGNPETILIDPSWLLAADGGHQKTFHEIQVDSKTYPIDGFIEYDNQSLRLYHLKNPALDFLPIRRYREDYSKIDFNKFFLCGSGMFSSAGLDASGAPLIGGLAGVVRLKKYHLPLYFAYQNWIEQVIISEALGNSPLLSIDTFGTKPAPKFQTSSASNLFPKTTVTTSLYWPSQAVMAIAPKVSASPSVSTFSSPSVAPTSAPSAPSLSPKKVSPNSGASPVGTLISPNWMLTSFSHSNVLDYDYIQVEGNRVEIDGFADDPLGLNLRLVHFERPVLEIPFIPLQRGPLKAGLFWDFEYLTLNKNGQRGWKMSRPTPIVLNGQGLDYLPDYKLSASLVMSQRIQSVLQSDSNLKLNNFTDLVVGTGLFSFDKADPSGAPFRSLVGIKTGLPRTSQVFLNPPIAFNQAALNWFGNVMISEALGENILTLLSQPLLTIAKNGVPDFSAEGPKPLAAWHAKPSPPPKPLTVAEKLELAKKDRAEGVLVGLAVGNALGQQYANPRQNPASYVPHHRKNLSNLDIKEFKVPSSKVKNAPLVKLDAGVWGSSVAEALCLSDVLLGSSKFSAAKFKSNLLQWNKGNLYKYPLVPVAFDIDFIAYEELDRADQLIQKDSTDKGALYALRQSNERGNGALARVAPLGIFYRNKKPGFLINQATMQAKVTHNSPLSIQSSELLAYMVRKAVLSKEPTSDEIRESLFDLSAYLKGYPQAKKKAKEDKSLHADIKDLLKQDASWLKKEAFDSMPYISEADAISTLLAAFWSVHHSHSFEEALTNAMSFDGDSATLGAVVGELAGAIYGYASIPNRWTLNIPRIELVPALDPATGQMKQIPQTRYDSLLDLKKIREKAIELYEKAPQ